MKQLLNSVQTISRLRLIAANLTLIILDVAENSYVNFPKYDVV